MLVNGVNACNRSRLPLPHSQNQTSVMSELLSVSDMQSMSYLRIVGCVMSMFSILVFVCALSHLLP